MKAHLRAMSLLRSGKVALLHPAEQVFEDMLAGWSGQQSSRLLSTKTIRARERHVRRFAEFCGSYPWDWTPGDVEEWTTQLLSGPRPLAPSSIRGYQNAVELFCTYLTDRRYDWGGDPIAAELARDRSPPAL